MASKKGTNKRTKRERASRKSDLATEEDTDNNTASGCASSSNLAEANVNLEVELAELTEEMRLVGSKGGNAKSVDDNVNGVTPGAYIPRSVLYYGWFFGETVSLALKNYANNYLQKCISDIPHFQSFISITCNGVDILEYFRKPKSSSNALKYHITAKFCGRTPDEVYENKAANHLETEFDLNIIGIFITKSTLGYRVELQKEQMELFDDERKHERRGQANSPSPDDSTTSTPKNSPTSAAGGATSKHLCKSKSSKKSSLEESKSEHPDYPGLVFAEQQSINFEPTNTRAHITIGCGPKVKAFRTGEELLDIIDLERQAATTTSTSKSNDAFSTRFDINDIFPPHGKSVLRQFGHRHGDAFVIYFSHKIIAKAIFMAYA